LCVRWRTSCVAVARAAAAGAADPAGEHEGTVAVRGTTPSIIAFTTVLASSCGGDVEPPAEPALNAEARVAEGTIVEAAPRLFSAPELDSLQRIGPVPDSIAVSPDTIVLAPDEAVPLSRIGLDARTAAGEQILALPVLLTLDADVADIEADSLRGVRTGESMLWVRSLIGRPEGDRGEAILVIVR
jgi:hypothetical protein